MIPTPNGEVLYTRIEKYLKQATTNDTPVSAAWIYCQPDVKPISTGRSQIWGIISRASGHGLVRKFGKGEGVKSGRIQRVFYYWNPKRMEDELSRHAIDKIAIASHKEPEALHDSTIGREKATRQPLKRDVGNQLPATEHSLEVVVGGKVYPASINPKTGRLRIEIK